MKEADNVTDMRTAHALSTLRPEHMEHVNGIAHICKVTCIDVCKQNRFHPQKAKDEDVG